MFELSNRSRLALSFLAGTILAAAFPNINLPWLAWLAPGLILLATRGVSGKSIFLAGFVAGLGHYFVSLYWLLLIPFPIHALLGYGGLCAVLAIFMGGWCWFCWRIARQPWDRFAWPLLCATAWVALEMVMARLFTGFPWNLLGTSQFRFLPLIQMASVTGVYGVSFLIVWVSVSLIGAVFLWRAGKFPGELAPPLLALAAVIVFGEIKLSEPELASSRLKIALVQPSIPQRVIWDANEKTNRFLKLMALSSRALAAHPDLLVWPEAAMPDVARNRMTQDAVATLVRPNHVWMVMGATDMRPKKHASKAGEMAGYNSAFLIDPNGDLAGVYQKRHLVLFGEYMPGAIEFPYLARLRSAGAGVTPGEHDVTFRINQPAARFPVLICFEDVFPHEVRRRMDDATDFLLDLANNAWFGESAAQWQHASSALFRAVENGVPLVRCANNGLTCWIDAHGRLHDIYFGDSRNIYQEGFKLADVPIVSGHHPTFYCRHGDWFGWSCALATAAALGWSVVNPRRDRDCRSRSSRFARS